MQYEIISTGSKGNALILDGSILIDCGVSYRALKDKTFDIVLLTHVHSDHFRRSTIHRLHEERPLLRFGCFPFLVDDLVRCGVDLKRIDVYEMGEEYDYGPFSLHGIELIHDVPNAGYILTIDGTTALYATDTASLGHVQAQGLDYYFIEANYKEEELAERIREKQERGEFCYESRVETTHLSYEQANAFLADNAASTSKIIFVHQHEA